MDKLQQLTQKLYEEGLSKGRSDADDLLNKAKEEARNIVNDARVKAESILHDARRNAEEIKKNTETEVALASRQTIATLKEEIQNLVTAKNLTPKVTEAIKDPDFLKKMILQVCQNWDGNQQSRTELEIMLPENTKEDLLKELRGALGKALDAGLEVKTSDSIKSGFKVAPKAGGYYISFTDQDFDELFQEYLRPKVAELLYGKEEK